MTIPNATYMPGVPKPMNIYQGDTKRYPFRVTSRNAATGVRTPVNLTGCTARAQIRVDQDTPTALVEFTATVAADQDASRGVVLLELTAVQTAALDVPNGMDTIVYKWDVEITYPDGRVQTFLNGDVVVWKQVTR